MRSIAFHCFKQSDMIDFIACCYRSRICCITRKLQCTVCYSYMPVAYTANLSSKNKCSAIIGIANYGIARAKKFPVCLASICHCNPDTHNLQDNPNSYHSRPKIIRKKYCKKCKHRCSNNFFSATYTVFNMYMPCVKRSAF